MFDIQKLNKKDIADIIKNPPDELFDLADSVRRQKFGNKVFVRGLIEISNYCKNDCFYCGIRNSNHKANRYSMSPQEILDACDTGYKLGFRTFVMQSGEDVFFSDELMCRIIKDIKNKYPNCAVTLSLGEKDEKSYSIYKEAGADRYLLRHETANESHYCKLHPDSLSLEKRKNCLRILKSLGFQTGAGFMVGSPFQTAENLAEDLLFLKALNPQMVGIGPFVPHRDTPFGNCPNGDLKQTLVMIALTRLMLPDALLPATTALSAVAEDGLVQGLRAGANVIMPNLTPAQYRKNYILYDNKPIKGDDVYENFLSLKTAIEKAGFKLDMSRGDFKNS